LPRTDTFSWGRRLRQVPPCPSRPLSSSRTMYPARLSVQAHRRPFVIVPRAQWTLLASIERRLYRQPRAPLLRVDPLEHFLRLLGAGGRSPSSSSSSSPSGRGIASSKGKEGCLEGRIWTCMTNSGSESLSVFQLVVAAFAAITFPLLLYLQIKCTGRLVEVSATSL